MNKFVLLGLLLNFVYFSSQEPVEISAELEAIINECVTESGVSDDIQRKFIDGLEMSEDSKFKCFLKCLAVNSEAMSEAGEVDYGALAEILIENELPRDTANQLTKACEKIAGSDICDTAYQVTTCLIQYAIDHHLFEE